MRLNQMAASGSHGQRGHWLWTHKVIKPSRLHSDSTGALPKVAVNKQAG